MGGPCPGEFCAGNELELEDLSLIDWDAASVTFEAVVKNHAISVLGNPNVCEQPDSGGRGIGGILTFQVRGFPVTKRVKDRCYGVAVPPPSVTRTEFKVEKPTPGTEPKLHTAEIRLCTSQTSDCSALRTEAFTVHPDGSVTAGDDTDGNGDGGGDDPLTAIQKIIERLGIVMFLVVVAIVFISIRDIFED